MPEQKLDIETKKITDSNSRLLELINHDGWKIARLMLTDKILGLQNVAEYMDTIQTGNATKLLREMKASARAAEILFDWLRQVEGDAQQSIEQKQPKKKSFIVDLDEQD